MIEHVYVEPEAQARQVLAVLTASGFVPSSQRILDVGCGTGTYASLLLEAGAASVTGIDISPQNIAIARERHPDPRLTLHVCSLSDFQSDASFDAVFAKGVLYYCGGLGTAANHIRRLLAPGGTIFASLTERNFASICANALKHFASRIPSTFRPAFRDVLAVVYRLLHASQSAQAQPFRVVRRKMNTIFFPADYLSTADQAIQTLAECGFTVQAIIPRKAWYVLRSDFGILAQADPKRS